ncbi:hypothetical protein R3W88_027543 [Solanum pinnatisectum]|uniref:R13L1/DRL21-like LRR repeat region domain-containing protein n=1 Tax=Solanum pinnatisectum TaxID=50273 RepID=A0AAV9LGH6_9SOLN|nr:hypothetical protein R3W88_027543 [Solanum pinnatisectum]
MPLKIGQLTCLQTLQFFKVGSKKGRRIEELGCLKNLRGALMIRDLQLVCNREEAVKACLREKPNISKLAYLWSHYVLDGLQPHTNLKNLVVVNYLGTRFPSWFSEELLSNLVELKLSGWRKCKEIPSLGQLKLLRHLELIGFHELECIRPTFYGVEVDNNGSSNNNTNIQVFPLLKELVLWNMPRLTEWKEVQLLSTGNDGSDRVGVRMFPGLEKLRIINLLKKLRISSCPLLKSTPNQFEILHEVAIEIVNSEMPLLNLCSNLTSLVDLIVDDVKELTCFPDEMLYDNVSLEHLLVLNCREFRKLPQKNHFTLLQSLELSNCDGLTSLPSEMLEHCRSLESLNVNKCLHRLTGLQELCIGPFSETVDFEAFQLIFSGIQQLSSLPKLELMQLSSLTEIGINDFGIKTLPERFGNLTSLETLELVRCRRRQHLDFLDAMPKLRHLDIRDCPSLEALLDGLVNLVSLQELTLWYCRKL